MTSQQIKNYLHQFEIKLLADNNWMNVQINREWAKKFPKDAGVYIIRENGEMCYVGESGSIRARMLDLLDTRNHVIRRNIGNTKYKNTPGFETATANKKFNPDIENKLNKWMERNLEISTIPVELGRKELEEYLFLKYNKPKYNKKGKRGSIF